jgi:hypothetical protein
MDAQIINILSFPDDILKLLGQTIVFGAPTADSDQTTASALKDFIFFSSTCTKIWNLAKFQSQRTIWRKIASLAFLSAEENIVEQNHDGNDDYWYRIVLSQRTSVPQFFAFLRFSPTMYLTIQNNISVRYSTWLFRENASIFTWNHTKRDWNARPTRK